MMSSGCYGVSKQRLLRHCRWACWCPCTWLVGKPGRSGGWSSVALSPPSHLLFRPLVRTVRDPSELPWHCNMPLFNSKPRLTLSSACRSPQFVTTIRHAKHSNCRVKVQMSGIAFSSATVTFCMYLIVTFRFDIFTLIQSCCKCVSNVSRDTYRGIPYCGCTYNIHA